MSAPSDREFFCQIIDQWKSYWMNQTQNSKEDYENYWRRAFGVDANMSYHLADLLTKATKHAHQQAAESVAELVEALESTNKTLRYIQEEYARGHGVHLISTAIDLNLRLISQHKARL